MTGQGGVDMARWSVELGDRATFDDTHHKGEVHLVDGDLTWTPDGWKRPIWRVPVQSLVAGGGSSLLRYEVWIGNAEIGALGLRIVRPLGDYAGGMSGDVRHLGLVQGFLEALRTDGASVVSDASIGQAFGSTSLLGWSFPSVGL